MLCFHLVYFTLESSATIGFHWMEFFASMKLKNGYVDRKMLPELLLGMKWVLNEWSFNFQSTIPLTVYRFISYVLLFLHGYDLWVIINVTKPSRIKDKHQSAWYLQAIQFLHRIAKVWPSILVVLKVGHAWLLSTQADSVLWLAFML